MSNCRRCDELERRLDSQRSMIAHLRGSRNKWREQALDRTRRRALETLLKRTRAREVYWREKASA